MFAYVMKVCLLYACFIKKKKKITLCETNRCPGKRVCVCVCQHPVLDRFMRQTSNTSADSSLSKHTHTHFLATILINNTGSLWLYFICLQLPGFLQ